MSGSSEDLGTMVAFIKSALRLKLKGDSSHYSQLVRLIAVGDDPDTLWKLLLGLEHAVTPVVSRPNDFSELVNSLCSFSWQFETKILTAFSKLIQQIISANTIFLVPLLRMLVRSLVPTHVVGGSSPEQAMRLREQFKHVHQCIGNVLRLVPTGQSKLISLLSETFPHKTKPAPQLAEYVAQLLHMCSYLPNFEDQILALITEKCVDIDVEIVIEDNGEVKIEEDADRLKEAEIFQLDDVPDTTQDASVAPVQQVDEMADKLDLMMGLLLKYLDEQLAVGGHSGTRVFATVQRSFETHVLTTHKSKYVQFTMFYLCSKFPSLSTLFPDRLLEIFLDESAAPTLRQSAVVYLASFLARANFLPMQYVGDVLVRLLSWTDAYVVDQGADYPSEGGTDSDTHGDEWDAWGAVPPPRYVDTPTKPRHTHGTFYSAVQGACYVMCFYGAELATQQRMDNAQHVRWNRVLTSTLEPLRYCLESVRREFLRLAEHVGLIEEDSWAVLPEDLLDGHERHDFYKGGVGGMGKGANPLDSYFPFDPYLLRRSHRYFDSNYRYWQGLSGIDVEGATTESSTQPGGIASLDTPVARDDDDGDIDAGSYAESGMVFGSIPGEGLLRQVATSHESSGYGESFHEDRPVVMSPKEAMQAWANMKRARANSVLSAGGSW